MDATQYGELMKKLENVMSEIQLQPVIVNPNSNFVVATYWWGRGNINKNLQKPCPEDIVNVDDLYEEISEMLEEDDPSFKDLRLEVETIKRITPRTPAIKKELKTKIGKILKVVETFLKSPQGVEYKAKRIRDTMNKLQTEGKFKAGETYDKMIDTWNEDCKKQNCNYLSAEYTFFQQPGMYQYGINAKPLFIKKALQSSGGRGILYIDGDMRPNKYPAIFDLKNVDYIARGWNIDPRSSPKYETDICVDPYIFETSGGIMYFADTPWSHKLLDAWIEELTKFENKGKAEDRVISLIVMERDFMRQMNIIQLPIEHLWLTDLYTFQNSRDTNVQVSVVEHPACLTGEERAMEQSNETPTSSREPVGYWEKIDQNVKCDTKCGIFYEYIFFPRKESMTGFEPYLEYIKCLKFKDTNERVFEDVVDYDNKYGDFNAIAYQNDTTARGLAVSGAGDVTLPQTATIPEILAHLYNRQNVKVGDVQNVPENCDVFATITTYLKPDERYFKTIEIDTSKPMFFSVSNVIVQHLLRMCETTQDINKHVSGSYMFFSRIHWGIENPFVPADLPALPPPVPAVEPELPSTSESVPITEPELASTSETIPITEPELASTSETIPITKPELASTSETIPITEPSVGQTPLERLRNARNKTFVSSVAHPGMSMGAKRKTYRKRIMKRKQTKRRQTR